MLQRILDDQYRRPTGLLGRYIGAQMARDHRPENLWTVANLHAAPTDEILEIGCGAGVALQALAAQVTTGRVVGLDVSPTMVAAARRRNAQAIRAGRVALHCGDAAALPFAAAAFDKAFSIHSIYFWPRPQAALRAIARVLRPGGTLLLTVLPKERWNAADPDQPVGTPTCTPYSGADLLALLGEAGFGQSHLLDAGDPACPSCFAAVGIKAAGER